MNNPFDEIAQAVEVAKDTQRAIAKQSTSMARLLMGNLHHVNEYVLVELKRELREFDAHKRQWKK